MSFSSSPSGSEAGALTSQPHLGENRAKSRVFNVPGSKTLLWEVADRSVSSASYCSLSHPLDRRQHFSSHTSYGSCVCLQSPQLSAGLHIKPCTGPGLWLGGWMLVQRRSYPHLSCFCRRLGARTKDSRSFSRPAKMLP